MRVCPCCQEYGDVWKVRFENLNGLEGILCFECDSVWGIASTADLPLADCEQFMRSHSATEDWDKIAKIAQVQEPYRPYSEKKIK